MSNKSALRTARRLETALQDIVREFPWPRAAMRAASGGGVEEPVHEHYYQVFCLFADDDVVWCGRDVHDTGSPDHSSRFRTVAEWLGETKCPGMYVCPNTFKAGVYSRCNQHVQQTKFLVVESDHLSKDEIGAVFRWLKEGFGLRLRIVVDTAGKSLHGWFDYPAERELEQLKTFLPAIGCDPALFNSSQPCRLAGAVRDGRYQQLIYTDQ